MQYQETFYTFADETECSIMQKSNFESFDNVLNEMLGAEGTPKREANRAKAYDEYLAEMVLEKRKEAGLTQSELARRLNTTKSYISKIEHGVVNPSATMFLRIIDALGFNLVLSAE